MSSVQVKPLTPALMDKLNGNLLTPNRAKRNLNESFDYTPKSQSDTPILNYSIVENSTDDEQIKLKLKISRNQSQPRVVLKNLNVDLFSNEDEPSKIVTNDSFIDVESWDGNDDEVSDTNLRRSSRTVKPPVHLSDMSLRRSSRTNTRVSYNEYSSPRKTRQRSCDSDEVIILTPKKKPNVEEKPVSTPTRRRTLVSEIKEKSSAMKIIEESPSKLGLEKMAISTPSKELSPRKRPRKQNLQESFTYTPGKQKVAFNDDKLNIAIENENFEAGVSVPARRMTRRSSRLKDVPIYSDLEELLAPLINIKFTDNYDLQPKTPTKSTKSVNRNEPKTPKTPRMSTNRLKMLRNGEITPSMHVRQSTIVQAVTPLNKAKEKLHVSYVPKALPCREKEFEDIYAFIEGKLADGCGGCMYISGVPGTGKTATVTEVIRRLEAMPNKTVPKFKFVSINGMRLTEPRQSYVEILKQLSGKTVPWEQAQSLLDSRFTKNKGAKDEPIVLLVDELDILCTKRQDVVYNLLDWPTKAKAQLIVLTIANTMDLPERLLMGRVTSRLGLTRLTFQAYTHKQLQEIVMKRLTGTNAFNPDAVQLVARKVASVSGDARRALDICRRAAEIAELDGPDTLVTMQHINDALNAMITQPKVRAIKQCSRLEQLLLRAVAAEVERTGVDETTFNDVYTMLASVAGIDGFSLVSITLALGAVSRLGACRLLLTDQKSNDLHQRLILNVSADDIYYALRSD